MATTYYHVAGDLYEDGAALLPWSTLQKVGIPVPWTWEEMPEGTDGDVVCVYSERAEAEEHAATYGGRVLTIAVPDGWQDGDEMFDTGVTYITPRRTRVAEGFTAFEQGIPAAWIRPV